MQVTKIDISIFNYVVYCYLARNPKELADVVKSAKRELDLDVDNFDNYHGLTYSQTRASCILVNGCEYDFTGGIKPEHLIKLLGTIRHEVHHAVTNMFEAIEHKSKVLDEEVFVWSNDFVFEQILFAWRNKLFPNTLKLK